MADPKVIQVGIKALRTPSGEFMPAMPIYQPTSPELEARETAMLEDYATAIAPIIRDYIEKQKKVKEQTK